MLHRRIHPHAGRPLRRRSGARHFGDWRSGKPARRMPAWRVSPSAKRRCLAISPMAATTSSFCRRCSTTCPAPTSPAWRSAASTRWNRTGRWCSATGSASYRLPAARRRGRGPLHRRGGAAMAFSSGSARAAIPVGPAGRCELNDANEIAGSPCPASAGEKRAAAVSAVTPRRSSRRNSRSMASISRGKSEGRIGSPMCRAGLSASARRHRCAKGRPAPYQRQGCCCVAVEPQTMAPAEAVAESTCRVEPAQDAARAGAAEQPVGPLEVAVAGRFQILVAGPHGIAGPPRRAAVEAARGRHRGFGAVADEEARVVQRLGQRAVLAEGADRQAADGAIGRQRHRDAGARMDAVVRPGIMPPGVEGRVEFGHARQVLILQPAAPQEPGAQRQIFVGVGVDISRHRVDPGREARQRRRHPGRPGAAVGIRREDHATAGRRRREQVGGGIHGAAAGATGMGLARRQAALHDIERKGRDLGKGASTPRQVASRQLLASNRTEKATRRRAGHSRCYRAASRGRRGNRRMRSASS